MITGIIVVDQSACPLTKKKIHPERCSHSTLCPNHTTSPIQPIHASPRRVCASAHYWMRPCFLASVHAPPLPFEGNCWRKAAHARNITNEHGEKKHTLYLFSVGPVSFSMIRRLSDPESEQSTTQKIVRNTRMENTEREQSRAQIKKSG